MLKPVMHFGRWNPVAHPFMHFPSMWLHVSLLTQCPHLFLHFCPNVYISHSEIQNQKKNVSLKRSSQWIWTWFILRHSMFLIYTKNNLYIMNSDIRFMHLCCIHRLESLFCTHFYKIQLCDGNVCSFYNVHMSCCS